MKPWTSPLVKLSKTFTFDAAHYLPLLPEGHKCRAMHGHTYCVELHLLAEPDDTGIILDFDSIDALWRPVAALVDHKVLNEVEGLENPTCECLCQWIADKLAERVPHLSAVRVYESSTTWCEATVIRSA